MTNDTSNANRLCVFSGGFLNEGRLKRILELSGWDVSLGLPGDNDWVGIWGRTPTAWRGEAVAGWADAPVLTVEDALLRSVHPNRLRPSSPVGLFLDKTGVHFDGTQTSDLEKLLATHPLDDTALLNRARAAMAQMAYWHLGKYSATDPNIVPPDPGYVVVIDQSEGDAALMGAGRDAFLEMLTFALEENPASTVYIKTHPETAGGARKGHFREEDYTDRVRPMTEPISPWRLFEGAVGVYSHSSTLGFEAIFTGHNPRIFGQPFYAGWGLTRDEHPVPRRERKLTRAQMFSVAMILYPVWYDPIRDCLCDVEDVIAILAAEARAWREDRHGYQCIGMSPWKRPHLSRAFGRETKLKFARKATPNDTRKSVVWGMADAPVGTLRMEDGFLRSRGLGAELTPPLSLVLDQPSLYFDPGSEGQLDRLIAESDTLPLGEIQRAERLMKRISHNRLTKYNIGDELPEISTDAPKILVVGQVEDDASVIYGAHEVKSNRALLEHTRAQNPDACLLWKPHPDVEAGLRLGHVENASQIADHILTGVSAEAAMTTADQVWTITSTLGFEALLRDIPVTCLGMPFYAGRGLTQDHAPRPLHRADAALAGLVHACLIGYPRYFDPRDGKPISPEAAVQILIDGVDFPRTNRALIWLHRLIAPFRR